MNDRRKFGRPGPRPNLWKCGPDPEAHDKYVAWLRAKAQASFRDEPWDLTYEQWVEAWGDQWQYRGRRADSRCLAREDWHGTWEPTNVRVITREEFHYQQMQIKLERGTIKNIRMRDPRATT